MTGPEHYREAEELEGQWATCRNERDNCPHCVMAMARAQVHATLALAAATAEHVTAATYDSWWATVGGPERAE